MKFRVLLLGLFLLQALFEGVYADATQYNFSSKSSNHTDTEVSTSYEITKPAQQPIAGEKLIYDVYWLGFHIGEGSLEVVGRIDYQSQVAYHIQARAKTNDFLTHLFPVDDVVDSYVRPEDLRPLFFSKKISEGRYRAHEEIVFDISNSKAYFHSLKNGDKKSFDIMPDSYDMASSLYWMRSLELGVGKVQHCVISDENKHWDLSVETLRLETLKTTEGNIPCFVTRPTTAYKGILYKRGHMTLWVALDASRTVQQVQMSTPYGLVTGKLRRNH